MRWCSPNETPVKPLRPADYSFRSFEASVGVDKFFLVQKVSESVSASSPLRKLRITVVTAIVPEALLAALQFGRCWLIGIVIIFRRNFFRKENIQFSSRRFFLCPEIAHDAQSFQVCRVVGVLYNFCSSHQNPDTHKTLESATYDFYQYINTNF